MLVQRIPKNVLYFEAHKRSRKRGRPLSRFGDACKDDLASFAISVDDSERRTECRSGWRSQLADGASFSPPDSGRKASEMKLS
ncbi:hypothetical protein Y1Q_0008287 [Alligator mississippiensis]|uniref:Uncharacterized protein n=1 Tax=Alligator mississippiensis TaxID=8496 RepID=A0A151N1M8_ALLMI|nr:hypothetical protein Y1Q_0008287 [Alligator mississippiensis]